VARRESAATAEEQRYAAAWRDRHRRVRLVWFSTLAGIALSAVVAIFATHLRAFGLFALAAIVWLIPGIFAQLHLNQFRCPRCDENFYYVARNPKNKHLGYWRNRDDALPRSLSFYFSPPNRPGSERGRCANCFLPVNSPGDPDPPRGPDDG